jgi:prophage regulatory protein
MNNNLTKIIRLRELIEIIGLSRSTIYEKLNKASRRYDASFPAPIKLSNCAIGWRVCDVDTWITGRSQPNPETNGNQ